MQAIHHTTPKFYYPGFVKSPKAFKEGRFPRYEVIKVYEKIDGTNICLFRYKDAEGNEFVSYKTRLVPFLSPKGLSGFIVLWRKMIEKYAGKLEALIKGTRYNFGFELFGALNRILVDYDVSLDARLLFALDPDTGDLLEPSGFGFPLPGIVEEIGKDTDPDARYKYLEQYWEKLFNEGKPVEGCMLYVMKSDGKTITWKCKAPSVLEAACGGGSAFVGFSDAYVTAVNAMESAGSMENLRDETYRLLAEVYEALKVDISKGEIDRAIAAAKADKLLKTKVIDIFKGLGLKWDDGDKKTIGLVMRNEMQHFDKKDSAKVFGLIKAYNRVFR